jgi:hypothetical protein
MTELEMTLFGFFYLTNIGILGMMGLKTLSFAKARPLLTVGSLIFSWLLVVLRELNWALFDTFLKFFLHLNTGQVDFLKMAAK